MTTMAADIREHPCGCVEEVEKSLGISFMLRSCPEMRILEEGSTNAASPEAETHILCLMRCHRMPALKARRSRKGQGP